MSTHPSQAIEALPTIQVDWHSQVDFADGWLPQPEDFDCWLSSAFQTTCLQQALQDMPLTPTLLRAKHLDIGITLTDPQHSQQVNQQYRQKNRPTNILSFNGLLNPELGLTQLGDLLICAEVVASEAAQQGKLLRAHWLHLTLHGLLHLLGFDHQTQDQAQIMETLEIKLLQHFAVENPYLDQYAVTINSNQPPSIFKGSHHDR